MPPPPAAAATADPRAPAAAQAATPAAGPAATPAAGPAATPARPAALDVQHGLAYGALGVAIFALTIPMTRLASGSAAEPQLSAVFVAVGRAALAGVLAALYLAWRRAPRPTAAQWRQLALTALGIVFGFPLFMGLAVLQVDAVHASVVTGILPLVTAVLAALMLRQPQRAAFWLCAALGAALVVAFAAWRGGTAPRAADGLLLLALLFGGFGYVSGARLASAMPPQHVVSWVLVLALPVTLPIALAAWPAQPVRAASWLGFGYVALFSMWLGFFAWYRGLALGGTVRVSQVQLLQPFLSALAAVPVLGEALDAATIAFLVAVMAVVFASRRLARTTPPQRQGVSR
ncbi:MAG: DMT family transporter [Burkholderiaceae bacterium]